MKEKEPTVFVFDDKRGNKIEMTIKDNTIGQGQERKTLETYLIALLNWFKLSTQIFETSLMYKRPDFMVKMNKIFYQMNDLFIKEFGQLEDEAMSLLLVELAGDNLDLEKFKDCSQFSDQELLDFRDFVQGKKVNNIFFEIIVEGLMGEITKRGLELK